MPPLPLARHLHSRRHQGSAQGGRLKRRTAVQQAIEKAGGKLHAFLLRLR